MKHTRVVSTKCTPGFACRAFSDTTLVCFIVNEHTTKCSRYNGQGYGCWWLGKARGQGISRNYINQILFQNIAVLAQKLPHWSLVTHPWIRDLDQHWFRYWFAICFKWPISTLQPHLPGSKELMLQLLVGALDAFPSIHLPIHLPDNHGRQNTALAYWFSLHKEFPAWQWHDMGTFSTLLATCEGSDSALMNKKESSNMKNKPWCDGIYHKYWGELASKHWQMVCNISCHWHPSYETHEGWHGTSPPLGSVCRL